jgi:hypothetical protein
VSGWYPDPTGRFEYRFHNDVHWTADVASNGQRYVDPLPPPGTNTLSAPPPPAGAPPPSGGANNGIAIAAMVCGIVAVTTAWIPFLGIVGLIAGIVALALGIPALSRSRATGRRRGPAIAGIVTGAIGIVLGVLGIVLTVALYRAVERFDDPGPVRASLTDCREDGGDLVAEGQLENLSSTTRDYSVLVRLGPGARDRVEIDDVAPGATATFVARDRAEGGGPDCRIVSVDGPIPFGLDPDLFED